MNIPNGVKTTPAGNITGKTIRIGVAGCGNWGPNLVRNFKGLHPACELKLLCDTDQLRLDHLKTLHNDVDVTRDYEHMFNGANLHAVVIVTPVRFHYPMAKQSLLAGRHTFIEKPMADSAEHCEELNDIAKRMGLVLMIGHTFMFSPYVRKIKELIDSGAIGKVLHVNALRLGHGKFQQDINVAWDLAPHDLSIIRHFLDEDPVSVNCTGTSHVKPGIEDLTTMSLSFPGGCTAVIQSSWIHHCKIREITIIGEKGVIVYDDTSEDAKIRIRYIGIDGQTPSGDDLIPYVEAVEPLKEECRHFIDCIRKATTPLTSGEDGRIIVEILEASSESLRNRGAEVAITTPSMLDLVINHTRTHHTPAGADDSNRKLAKV